MNFELPQINSLLRTALGLGSEDPDPDWSTAPQRGLEAGIAIARALVVLSLPFAISGQSNGSLFFLSPQVLTVLYSLYAAGLILAFVTIARRPAPLVLVAMHMADIFWACAFAASNHSLGPVLVLLVFPMLTATLRWGPSATLATTLAIVGILAGAIGGTTIGSNLSSYVAGFQSLVSVILLGVLFAHLGQRQRNAARAAQVSPAPPQLLSGTPAQIIQTTFEEAFAVFDAKHIQLIVEEFNTGRTFLWHAEHQESFAVVHSEEFDHSNADPYFQLMPSGDWVLHRRSVNDSLAMYEDKPKGRPNRDVPAVLADHFRPYAVVLSTLIPMGDDWRGRLIICDPAAAKPPRTALLLPREFCENAAQSIHTAHVCLRACRDTAAEERGRLARELHDGVIQSLLGVDLSLESMKRHLDVHAESQKEIQEVQSILRREAMGLRQLVNDSRRRALRPERLLEYLSDLLERFQHDSGVVTRFFADLDKEPMPPRICYEIARIAEECVINAHKHSRASTLTVRVGCLTDNWVLVIVDDGIGFGFRGVWSLDRLLSSGVGPRVIKERVMSLNGDLMIESTPTGARIEISIPKHRSSPGELHLQNRRALVACET